MLNLSQITAIIGVTEKLVPLIENVIKGLAPTVEVLGADASVIVQDSVKLLYDLKERVEALKASVSASTPPAA